MTMTITVQANEPIPAKRYLLQHRVSRRRQSVYADSFQGACEAVGWYPAETCLLKVEPCEEEPSHAPKAIVSESDTAGQHRA